MSKPSTHPRFLSCLTYLTAAQQHIHAWYSIIETRSRLPYSYPAHVCIPCLTVPLSRGGAHERCRRLPTAGARRPTRGSCGLPPRPAPPWPQRYAGLCFFFRALRVVLYLVGVSKYLPRGVGAARGGARTLSSAARLCD